MKYRKHKGIVLSTILVSLLSSSAFAEANKTEMFNSVFGGTEKATITTPKQEVSKKIVDKEKKTQKTETKKENNATTAKVKEEKQKELSERKKAIKERKKNDTNSTADKSGLLDVLFGNLSNNQNASSPNSTNSNMPISAQNELMVMKGKVSTMVPLESGGKELTNEDINKIFISIEKEFERERASRAKKVLSHPKQEVKKPVAKEKKVEKAPKVIKDLPPVTTESLNPGIYRSIDDKGKFNANALDIKFYGTMCENRVCVVFTSEGKLKKGSKIQSTGETIKHISKTHIVTNIRKIKL